MTNHSIVIHILFSSKDTIDNMAEEAAPVATEPVAEPYLMVFVVKL